MYEQYIGIRFHLGIIDNHNEMKKALESDDEFYIDDYMKVKVLKRIKRKYQKLVHFVMNKMKAMKLKIVPIEGYNRRH